jgi:hypothetical protein
MLATSLRTILTDAGETPSSPATIPLLRQVVTLYGGSPTQYSIVGLLREAITAVGGTPTYFDQVNLLRQLVTARGGTPTKLSIRELGEELAAIPLEPPAYEFTNSEAETFVGRMAVEPDDTRKGVIDDLFGALKSGALSGSNLLNKLNALWLFAAHNQADGRLNAIGNTFTVSETSSPTWSADQGYTFNGTSSLLDTGFNITTVGLSETSVHIGLYSMTSGQGPDSSSRADMGADALCGLVCRTTSDTVQCLLNRPALMTGNTGVTDGSGHFCGSRVANNDLKAYRNGVQIGTTIALTTGRSTANIAIGANAVSSPTAFSSRRITAAHIGSGLTQNEVTDIANALAAYMTAVGA